MSLPDIKWSLLDISLFLPPERHSALTYRSIPLVQGVNHENEKTGDYRIMKTLSIAVLLLLAISRTYGQPTQSNSSPGADSRSAVRPPDTEYVEVSRGPHSSVWRKTVHETGPNGKPVARVREYTEVAGGLNYFDPITRRWERSEEIIESFAGGAVARRGQTKVIFANDLATPGAIDMEVNGQRFRSHILGLSYFDAATSNSVMIAEATNCIGVVVPPNQVLYRNAFAGDVTADVLYTYTKGSGIEQDVILRTRPPLPEDYDPPLSSRTTRLQVLTEWITTPTPTVRSSVIPSGADDGENLRDDFLDFGGIAIGSGKAFSLGDDADQRDDIPVAKQWILLERRRFLVEEITIPAAAKHLDTLPLPRQAGIGPKKAPVRRTASIRNLPAPKLARPTTNRMEMARLSVPEQGFVLDYTTTLTSLTNFTFLGNGTFYLSANVSLYGTNTAFEGSAILKFASNVALTVNTPVTWLADSYRPVVMVAKDENRVGETISGSTGNPSGYYANPALNLTTGSPVLSNLRIAHARQAISAQSMIFTISHAQFVNCLNGVSLSGGTFNLRNVLFSNVATNLNNIGVCSSICG